MSKVENIVDIWANDNDWDRLEAAILKVIDGCGKHAANNWTFLIHVPVPLYNDNSDIDTVLRHLIATGVIIEQENESYVRRTDGWKPPNIVDVVDETTMLGDTLLERQLNAYLTNHFVLSEGVPADECLSEARDVARRMHHRLSP